MATRTQRRTASDSPTARSGTKKKKNKAVGGTQKAAKKKPSASPAPEAFPSMLSAMIWEPTSDPIEPAPVETDAPVETPQSVAQAEPRIPKDSKLVPKKAPSRANAQARPKNPTPDAPPAPERPANAETPPTEVLPQPVLSPAPGPRPAPAATVAQEVAPAAPPTATDLSAPLSPHPVEDFLSGVLEGLPGPVNIRLACAIGANAKTLPVRQLLFLGQALQLLITALDSASTEPCPFPETLPILSVHLDLRADARLALRVYDDGRYFDRFLPDASLEREGLRPLVLFVTKQGGSIRLIRGHCLEFAIIR